LQPKQWAKKEAVKTANQIENRTQPELVPNQASKSTIVRGAHIEAATQCALRYPGTALRPPERSGTRPGNRRRSPAVRVRAPRPGGQGGAAKRLE
jgi:hypothetical protein